METSGQIHIFAALPPVAMELEDGRAADSVFDACRR